MAGKFSETKFENLIAKAVEEQYDTSAVERFLQLNPAERVLLIDDFHLCNLNRPNQRGLIEAAKNRFRHIYGQLASDAYGVRELKADDPLLDFENAEIKEFGHPGATDT